MVFNGKGKLVFDLSDTVFCPWRHPAEGLATEMSQIYHNNGGVMPRFPDPEVLANLKGNLFIWGHGNEGHIINDGGDQNLSPGGLAALLQRCGLRLDFKGHIVLWSCWGGVAGGFARSLSRYLGNLGYAVPVWGSKYIPCNMEVRRFKVIKKMPSDDVSNIGPDMAERAYKGDMVMYQSSGAGLRQAPAPGSGLLSNWSMGWTPSSGSSAGI